MQYKIAELEGALLDTAVAMAQGWTVDRARCTDPSRPNDPIQLGEPGDWSESEHFAPSSRWQDAGPIVERERIDLSNQGDLGWRAWVNPSGAETYCLSGYDGDTPLIAAMRAFVAEEFGETVELP